MPSRRSSSLEICYFCDDPWLAVGVTILGIFVAFLQHFSGSSSELSPRISAQALALETLVFSAVLQ